MVKAEDLAAKDRAPNEANQRVAQLESTLRDMQKTTQLKGQSMWPICRARAEAGKAKTAEPTKTEPPKVEAPKSVVTPAPITPAPVTRRPLREQGARTEGPDGGSACHAGTGTQSTGRRRSRRDPPEVKAPERRHPRPSSRPGLDRRAPADSSEGGASADHQGAGQGD